MSTSAVTKPEKEHEPLFATPSPDSPPPPSFLLKQYIHTLSPFSGSQVLVLTLFLLSCLHGIGLLLFTRGFLLSRLALEDINTCDPLTSNGDLNPSCSLTPTHSKMVFIIIDALRSDFIFPVNSSLTTPQSQYYQNHITLPAQLTEADPTRSFLSHFIADAPTTTLQRLKALTTGSLPTFIEAGNNFAGERVTEDNWLNQAKRNGNRIAMVGDDTWLAVFPEGEHSVWEESLVKPYDSFNVEDLDTVDFGVKEQLLKSLDTGIEDWDILIAHGLGLDHAGHRFGPSHSETTRKLKETQELLEAVVEKLDSDTLLVVMGDHGMTDTGDHGGDSREELEAGLWIYSKGAALTDASFFKHPTTSTSHPLAELFSSASDSELPDRLELSWVEKSLTNEARSISQVDIVPTISLLLGLPIPFGNLGLPIPELFFRESTLPIAPGTTEDKPKPKRGFFGLKPPVEPRAVESLSPLQTLLQASLLTSSQLSLYLSTYTSSPSGKDLLPAMPELTFILSMAKSNYRGAHGPGHVQSEMELMALKKFWNYGRKAREKAREVWARFDLNLMIAGLGIWLGSLIVGFRLIRISENGIGARFLIGRGLEGFLIAIWGILSVHLLGGWRLIGGLDLNKIVFILAAAFEVGVIISPSSSSKEFLSKFKWQHLLPTLPVLAHAALFASNSFTVFEDSSVLFILSTLLLLTFLRSFSAPEKRLRNRLTYFSLTALVAVRLMAYSTVCREEQAPLCSMTFNLGSGSKEALIAIGLATIAAWFIPTILRKFLALSASDESLAPIFLSYGIRFLLLGSITYWGIDWIIAAFSLSGQENLLAVGLKTQAARAVMAVSITLATVVWYISPLCLRMNKTIIKDALGNDLSTQVQLIGFANTFGSSYLLFFSALFSLLFLVNPPQGQIVLTLHLIIILCLLEIFDSERDVDYLRNLFSTKSVEQAMSAESTSSSHTGPTFTQISILALLSHLSFFATGHQASFSTIQWSTAFIGFPTILYPFSPILVLLNTLSPSILTSLALPLFVFWNLSPTINQEPALPLLRTLLKTSVSYSTYQAIISFSAAVFAGHFKRHLMVWKIFAPRFMISGITLLVTDVVLVVFSIGFGSLIVLRKVKNSLGSKFIE